MTTIMEEDWKTFTTFDFYPTPEHSMEATSTSSSPTAAASPLQQTVDWEQSACASDTLCFPPLVHQTLNTNLLPDLSLPPLALQQLPTPEPLSTLLTFCNAHKIKTQSHPYHTLHLQVPKKNHNTFYNTISQAASRFIKEKGPEYGQKGWVNWRKAREFVWGINSDVWRREEADFAVVEEFLRVLRLEVELAERLEC
ncbi:hypothetical protein HK097_000969 [Rhizophlyctis rosea]|uniref:Uncharacterized protein n=1 Tax=Rhizophlyctis rosea TaxID=64517 RepID=A0AAD5X892_9FUNG|nr:hypothetical protein HK097_000969 [Rhizophlyctis rosea]